MARVGLGALARGRSYAISGFANYLSAHRCEDFYDVASGLRKSGQAAHFGHSCPLNSQRFLGFAGLGILPTKLISLESSVASNRP